ncbi:MAG: hypothetical protein ACK4K9_10015 [Bacteroidia bacterium]
MKNNIKKILLALLIIGLSLVTSAQTLNIPPNHASSGTLQPPIPIASNNPDAELWTIVNNSNCDLTFYFWFTIDDPNGDTKHIKITVNKFSNFTIGASQLLELFGYRNFNLTHSSFEMKDGSISIGYGYPYTGGRLEKEGPQSEEDPCHCLYYSWNHATQTIYIQPCP